MTANRAGSPQSAPRILNHHTPHSNTHELVSSLLQQVHLPPMPPSRALSGAFKPLSASPILHQPNLLPRSASTPIQLQSSSSSSSTPQNRALSSAHPASSTDTEHPSSHSDHYDPPSGWLFNVPPGEKYKKEGWETVWVWGVWGSLGATAVAYAYKPDTS